MAEPDLPPLDPDTDIRSMGWRAFGQAPDLDLDFASPDRPALVTRLLALCLPHLSAAEAEDRVWSLTLSARIGALAAVVARTQSTPSLSVRPLCPACGGRFEVDLPFADLIGLASQAQREPLLRADTGDGRTFLIRRPTGADQRRWREASYPSAQEAESALLASLLAPESAAADRASLTAIAQSMQQQDLLAAFEIACSCPSCGREADYPLDLEAHLLARLETHLEDLTREIHRFASRYGWTEREVLAVAPARRAAYLRLMDGKSQRP
jgi:hypothetical protein